jgi:outer membrane protein
VKTTHLLSLALALTLGAMPLFAQQRIGYVNSPKIFEELPEAKDASKRLEAFAKPVQDTLATFQKRLEEKVEEYQKKEGMMNDAAKKSAQQEIQDLQLRAREYATAKDQELAKHRERILAPLKEKIMRAIERVAKAEKYSYVLDQNDQLNILLYAEPKDDLTNRVLDNLKRGK